MTLTSKKQHEKDRENQRKLEGDHHHQCWNCKKTVSDQSGFCIGGRWFCDKYCCIEYIERLEHKADQYEQSAGEPL